MSWGLSHPCLVLEKFRPSEFGKRNAARQPKLGWRQKGLQEVLLCKSNDAITVLKAVRVRYFFTVTFALTSGININIYKHKCRLKVYFTAEKYISKFHIVYRKQTWWVEQSTILQFISKTPTRSWQNWWQGPWNHRLLMWLHRRCACEEGDSVWGDTAPASALKDEHPEERTTRKYYWEKQTWVTLTFIEVYAVPSQHMVTSSSL